MQKARQATRYGKIREEQQTSHRIGKTPKGECGTQDGDCVAKKSESLSRGKECPSKRDWARVIEELRQEGHPLEYMLMRVKMARSVFYYHLARLNDVDGHADMRKRIKAIYDENKGRYGYRRICMDLRNKGYMINHKTVWKLMSQIGLKAKRKKRHYHSYKGQTGKIAPNIIDRDFSAERPNLKMVTDMLRKALRKYKELAGLTIHSDQGWHYQHMLYQKMLKNNNIVQSMSCKGNCLDNSMMENFFGLMKNELLYVNDFDSVDSFETELRKYILWYNTKRIKLRLKGMSPAQYRAQYYREFNN